jgi:curved DNA-binding protein CbpA
MTQSLYDILGVPRTATQEEIKNAYRKMSKITHPDAGGATDEFTKCCAAYETLSDPDRRARYDTTGDVDDLQPIDAEARDFVAGVIATGIEQIAMDQRLVESIPSEFWSMVRRAITEEDRANNKTVAMMKRRHSLLVQAHENLKQKGDKSPDQIRPMIDHMAKAISRNVAQAQRRSEVIAAAFVVIDSYEFKGNRPEEQPEFRRFTTSVNSTTGFSY